MVLHRLDRAGGQWLSGCGAAQRRRRHRCHAGADPDQQRHHRRQHDRLRRQPWFGVQAGGGSAIEQVSPSGQVTPYRDCLRYGQPYFGPATLVTGADGDIYFTSIASRSLPSISDPPSIGRITPNGEIVQIYAGVDAEAPWILDGPDGAIWFSAGANQIQRIAPFTGPANTFRVAPLRRASPKGAATAYIDLPGPGTVSLKPLAFIPRHHAPVPLHGAAAHSGTTTACTAAQFHLRPIGAAKQAFHQRGFATEQVGVTSPPPAALPTPKRRSSTSSAASVTKSPRATTAAHPRPASIRAMNCAVPQPGQAFLLRPPTLRFNYQPAGSYGEEEPGGKPLYPPFTLTGLGHWTEWHKREERNGVPAEAVTTGLIHYNTCTPNCAHGRQVTAPAQVKLDGENFCFIHGDHDVQTFERLTVRVGNGPPRTRFIECNGKLRPGKRSDVIPPGVGFFH